MTIVGKTHMVTEVQEKATRIFGCAVNRDGGMVAVYAFEDGRHDTIISSEEFNDRFKVVSIHPETTYFRIA